MSNISSKITAAALKKFNAARYGLFLHWGLYSLPGGRWKGQKMDYIGEWLQSAFRIPCAEYAQLAKSFNPVEFNAENWVKVAKDAGIKYIVYTAKHHDGFAMYHSNVNDYCITRATPFNRDPLAELAAACRKFGMLLGIYYSHCLDWHEKDAADPDKETPKNFGMSWGNDWDFPQRGEKHFSVYLEGKVKPQLQELLTRYGDILLVWFDCSNVITREQALNLRQFVKKLQPQCLINSRIGYDLGDFGSLGDNQHPASTGSFQLESPNTLNRTWGFKWDDHNWQDAASVVTALAKLNSSNVNYLLNIGPRPDGKLPEPAMDVLAELGRWRKQEKYVIGNSRPSPLFSEPPWGWCTVAGRTIQLVLRNDWVAPVEISGIIPKVLEASCPYMQNRTEITVFPGKPECDGLRVVRLKFSAPISVRQGLYPQSGVLNLAPVSGIVLREDNLVSAQTQSNSATGEWQYEGCQLTADGALVNWHHPGDNVAWNIILPGKCQYAVTLITESMFHSGKWYGNREVEVEFAGKIIRTRLQNDQDLGGYYMRALSHIGTVPAGTGHLVLRTVKAGCGAESMKLAGIILSNRIPDTASGNLLQKQGV